VADWVTISSIASAGGTLVLAGATFYAVRSSNRSARIAERALLVGLRPLLVSSHRDDPPQKIYFADQKYVVAPGGGAGVEMTDDAVYLGIALRNAGNGTGVLHGWYMLTEDVRVPDHRPLEDFVRLTRDLYVAAGDIGYWQGSFRDPFSEDYRRASDAVRNRESFGIEVLYGDEEGGQRMISRFGIIPRGDSDWLAESARHWNLDRSDPR
jgi:hypothetical protein